MWHAQMKQLCGLYLFLVLAQCSRCSYFLFKRCIFLKLPWFVKISLFFFHWFVLCLILTYLFVLTLNENLKLSNCTKKSSWWLRFVFLKEHIYMMCLKFSLPLHNILTNEVFRINLRDFVQIVTWQVNFCFRHS